MKVAVFCGSAPGNSPIHAMHAGKLGELLARAGIGIVYGGGNEGLMGELARAALAHGGQVCGIIPSDLLRRTRHLDLSEFLVAPDMHTRKRMMHERADAFIVLPGGIGTLEEFSEIFTWLQLGFHTKPIVLLNSGGYYNTLLAFLDQAVEEGFLDRKTRAALHQSRTPESVITQLENICPEAFSR